MTPRIVVCGEALFDVFVAGAQGSRHPAELVAGGSPFNVALGLARLGRPVAFLGGLSRDALGDSLHGILAREGVDLSLACRKVEPTTLSVVAGGPDGQPRYAFYGADAADRALRPADLPADLGACTALVMGSYTLVVQPVADTLAALAAREGGSRVLSLDPNIRPSVIGDLPLWPSRFERFVRHATIVKASDEDVALAFGGGIAPAEAASLWRAQGASLVVVTQGARGAVAFSGGEPLVVPARSVPVVDTVGAGDSFHAALLAGLDRRGLLSRDAVAALPRETLGAILDEAARAAAVTCSRRGADLPTLSDLSSA